jgi:hypothetical protein
MSITFDELKTRIERVAFPIIPMLQLDELQYKQEEGC